MFGWKRSFMDLWFRIEKSFDVEQPIYLEMIYYITLQPIGASLIDVVELPARGDTLI